MKCLRCNEEMKQYPFNEDMHIWGKEHQENTYSAISQTPHNPKSVYVCEKCGYVEFNMNQCTEQNI